MKVSTFNIYDSHGNRLHTEENLSKVLTYKMIDLSNYPNGIYFLELVTDDLILKRKIMIQKEK